MDYFIQSFIFFTSQLYGRDFKNKIIFALSSKIFLMVISQQYVSIFAQINKMNKSAHNTTVLHIQPKSNLLATHRQDNNLPAICQPRHYLIKSMSKNNTSLTNIFAPQIRKRLSKNNEEAYRKTTIYNIQFRKSTVLNSSKSKTISYNDYLNHASMDKAVMPPRKQNARWRISNFLNKQGSRASIDLNSDSTGKLKTISVNSQMVDVAEESLKMSLNGFSPKMTQLDLSKKQIQFLTKNLQRYQQYKSQHDAIDSGGINIKNYGITQRQQTKMNQQHIKKRDTVFRNRFTHNSKKVNEPEKFVKRGVSCTPWAFEENPQQLIDFL